jgi:hypothetical protein
LRLYKIANLAASRAEGRFVGFMPVAITPTTADRILSADVTLALSVFHRWCEAFGYADAVAILRTVWSRTRRVLFFEMPNPLENRSIRDFVPTMGETPDAVGAAIAEILTGLEECDVTLLGRFPTDFRGEGEYRHLFSVTRVLRTHKNPMAL